MPAIRPQTLSEFVGQPSASEVLGVAVRSALIRKKPLGHVLITGSPGLGKTTLAASVLPKEMGVPAKTLVCSAIENPTDFLPTLSTMKGGEILFLDEIHALPKLCFEHLYSVLEDSQLSIVLGQGKDAQVLLLTLDPFTVVAATTREGLISEPLRDRFKHHVRLELYSDADMASILVWTAEKREAYISLENAQLLVQPCHGTARHAGRLIEGCIDTVAADSSINPAGRLHLGPAVITATLKRLGYSANGLTRPEVALLKRLAVSDGPVGLNTLASILDDEADTVETVFEPWLLLNNMIQKTPGGRIITRAGKAALKKATTWK